MKMNNVATKLNFCYIWKEKWEVGTTTPSNDEKESKQE